MTTVTGASLHKMRSKLLFLIRTRDYMFFLFAESFTADHKPLMGEAPEVRGFFLGCGFNSAGKSCRDGNREEKFYFPLGRMFSDTAELFPVEPSRESRVRGVKVLPGESMRDSTRPSAVSVDTLKARINNGVPSQLQVHRRALLHAQTTTTSRSVTRFPLTLDEEGCGYASSPRNTLRGGGKAAVNTISRDGQPSGSAGSDSGAVMTRAQAAAERRDA